MQTSWHFSQCTLWLVNFLFFIIFNSCHFWLVVTSLYHFVLNWCCLLYCIICRAKSIILVGTYLWIVQCTLLIVHRILYLLSTVDAFEIFSSKCSTSVKVWRWPTQKLLTRSLLQFKTNDLSIETWNSLFHDTQHINLQTEDWYLVGWSFVISYLFSEFYFCVFLLLNFKSRIFEIFKSVSTLVNIFQPMV